MKEAVPPEGTITQAPPSWLKYPKVGLEMLGFAAGGPSHNITFKDNTAIAQIDGGPGYGHAFATASGGNYLAPSPYNIIFDGFTLINPGLGFEIRDQSKDIIIRNGTNLWRIKDMFDSDKCHLSDLSNMEELTEIIDKVKPYVIYHLATYGAYPYQNELDKIVYTNILGTANLLKASEHIDYELFVNFGSSSEYGIKKFPMKETDLLEPVGYYAIAKSSQTLLCSHVFRENKKPIVTLRPFSVYGSYEEQTRFIPRLMKAFYFNEEIDLVSPNISHDYIYVDDVIDVCLMVDQLKRFAGEIFNVGTGTQFPIKDVVEILMKLTGKSTKLKWGKMESRLWDTNNWVANSYKITKLLNWYPKVSFGKGLSLTWEWYKSPWKSQNFPLNKNNYAAVS